MATRRKYTVKQRAETAGLAIVVGVTEAERQTGIPKETIQYWTEKPEFAQLRTRAREAVVADFWIAIQAGVEQVHLGLIGDAPLRDKATALATLVDRYALLNGEATQRTETRDVDPDTASPDLAAARGAYLTLVSARSGAVVGGAGEGAHPNGNGEVPPLPVPGEHPRGRAPKAAGPEGSSNGHQPNGRHRGEVAG
jgi:hypothetical protein